MKLRNCGWITGILFEKFGYRTIPVKNIMKVRQVKDKDMELTGEMLEEMAAVDIRDVDINSLTDLRDIKVDTKKLVPQKLASFAEQTNNVYIHRIGDYIVKARFRKEGSTIDDKMEEYLRRLVSFYSFFRVRKIPMIAPIRIIGATLINSHSNE